MGWVEFVGNTLYGMNACVLFYSRKDFVCELSTGVLYYCIYTVLMS